MRIMLFGGQSFHIGDLLLFIILFFLCLNISIPSQAQSRAPGRPDVGSVTRDAQRARPTTPPRQADPGLGSDSPAVIPEVAGGGTVFVKDFKLEDFAYLNEAEVQKVLEPYKGKNLTLGQLEEAAAKVSQLYREKGYPVVQVYLPKQSGEGGVIILRTLVGAFGSSGLENESLVSDWFLEKIIRANFREGRPVKRADLERAVLLISDLPGADLPKLNMGAGQKPGSTDFVVNVPKEKRFGAFFSSDNMGSRYTGVWRFMTGVDVNSPFRLGDKLSVFGLTSENRGINNLAVNYELPLSANGLRLNLGYSHVYYELGEEFEDFGATGKSDVFEGTLTYPLIRSGTRNLNLSFNVAHKKMEEDSAFDDQPQKSRTTLGKVRLTHEYWGNIFGKPFYSRLGGGVTFGKFRLPTAEQRALDARDEDGNFRYVNLDFLLNLSLSDRWSWSLSGSAQKTFQKNLDSGEQFSVTGANGVKAYRESISGDNGYLLGTEVRCRLPGTEWLDHHLGVFADYGRWILENEPYSTLSNQKSDSLADIGLSYYLNLPHFTVKTQLVHALGSRPQESLKEPKTYVSVMLVAVF